MDLPDVMAALKSKGSESVKRIFFRHGAREPFFGVKVADLKPLAKQLKGQQELALALYATGNGDAQYLAGMIADGRRMTKAQLHRWAKTASWDMVSGTTVPWVASEHPDGAALALQWIEAKDEQPARAGWNTLGALAATRPDAELPMKEYARLLKSLPRALPKAPDGVRYTMNNFVIACGTYLAPLGEQALATARALGRVQVDMGDTGCKVPEAEPYILKARRGAAVAPKRKTVRC